MDHTYNPDHPIQISEEQFCEITEKTRFGKDRAIAFAQVGADMQLAKVERWIANEWPKIDAERLIKELRAAMRPLPLSKRERALKILGNAIGKPGALLLMGDDIALIREALMEGQDDG